MNQDGLMTVEVMYHYLDRIGRMPEVNEWFPCDEAPSGSLFVEGAAASGRASDRLDPAGQGLMDPPGGSPPVCAKASRHRMSLTRLIPTRERF